MPTWPTDESVEKEIMDDLVSTLQALDGLTPYRTSVRAGTVEVIGYNPVQKTLFPTATLTPGRVEWDDSRFPMLMGTLSTTVTLIDDSITNGRKAIGDFITDAIQVLFVDHTRGGFARDTHVRSSEPYIPFGDDGAPLGYVVADLTVSVTFAHLRTNPSQAQ